MVGPERRLADGQRPLIKRFGLGMLALGVVEHRQTLQAFGDVGMIGAEDIFADTQRA